jgi:NAD(P)-dependent dehydrogenase (short-subunit alcohol dehydrogenase family)
MTNLEGSPGTVAITGAGGGLGREIGLKLGAQGHRVFGTALSQQEVTEAETDSGGMMSLTVTDITDEDAVREWVSRVTEGLGQFGLNVLISNAGILTPGPLEVLPLNVVRHEFEVNVFGGLAVINAFLPALRKARGRIVQIGAMTGRLPLPFNGPSSASKAALEAFADIYRTELKPFGIDFVIAQAGNMLTGGPAKTAAALERVANSMTDEQRELYGGAFGKFAAALNNMQTSGLGISESADWVIELVRQVPAPSRAPVGKDAEEILRLVREKSDPELDALRFQLVGLDENGS